MTDATAAPAPTIDPSEAAKILHAVAHELAGDVADVEELVAHPSPSSIRKVAVDTVMVLTLLAGAVGFVQTLVPASRGWASLALMGIGWGLNLAKGTADVLSA